ncbi:shikimate dehydrogenase [Pseudoclavibacter sp. VKM Ac-2867]|uniref:shikimate dehydrogenase n=1 Tax=Pseudoclavibacter sp. VKM Ac-2867 TaxID=2783829 RepID=UPI00188CA0CB|nr:shikimate dehydrogenase [Pseudoclavibacter sp. VKM Ac-2867]MBF4459340.1 shikimate dehydrogenase [Pseudoclavibacter sp. VKM Ac-2867]
MGEASTRLAVLGSPIGHSKSPAIHSAAYEVLGLDWSYERFDVPQGGLADFLASRGPGWRGFSVTMPLKHEARAFASTLAPAATEIGAVNTLVFDGADAGAPSRGWNTDVTGFVAALNEAGVDSAPRVRLLGAGGTAAAVIAALPSLAATELSIVVRSPERAQGMVALARSLGVEVEVLTFAEFDARPAKARAAELVVNTVPGDRDHIGIDASWVQGAVLFDVLYDPWPTKLATRWQAAGGQVVSGLELLLAQALVQVRLFTGRDESEVLPREAEVRSAMRTAALRVSE